MELQYGRTLSTTMHLEKEMYWNDKYTKGEDVCFVNYFYDFPCSKYIVKYYVLIFIQHRIIFIIK